MICMDLPYYDYDCYEKQLLRLLVVYGALQVCILRINTPPLLVLMECVSARCLSLKQSVEEDVGGRNASLLLTS